MEAAKKIEQIAVHVDDRTKLAIKRMAEHAGVTVSEYMGQIIETHLQNQYDLMVALQEAFREGTDSSG